MHTWSRAAFSAAAALLFLASSLQVAAAEECRAPMAQIGFKFRADKQSSNPFAGDSGIVPDGFVGIPDAQVVHGVDVSKYENKIDFAEAVRCGARFVYVRLSAGSRKDNELEYRTLWQNARGSLRAVHGFVGGYHNFSFAEPAGKSGFSRLSNDRQKPFSDQSLALAKTQAELVLERLTEVLNLDVKADCDASAADLGCPYLPVALDLSTRPQMVGSSSDKEAFGRAVYGPAICKWVETVKASPSFRDQPVVLFVAPDTWKDFALDQAPCRLGEFPVWVRDHNRTGGLPGNDPASGQAELVGQLCQMKGAGSSYRTRLAGRCLFHQYTSFGGFAVFNLDAALDLNRYYGTASELESILQKARR